MGSLGVLAAVAWSSGRGSTLYLVSAGVSLHSDLLVKGDDGVSSCGVVLAFFLLFYHLVFFLAMLTRFRYPPLLVSFSGDLR